MNRYYGGVNQHTGKAWSSYSCILGDIGIDGVEIDIHNCESQRHASGAPGSRCKLNKNQHCRKTQNASILRGKRNWAKIKDNWKNENMREEEIDKQKYTDLDERYESGEDGFEDISQIASLRPNPGITDNVLGVRDVAYIDYHYLEETKL